MNISSNSSEIKAKLKNCGININRLSKLNYACALGNTRDVNFLNKKKNQINDEDENGITPLILVCIIGYTRIIEFLIENGANINKPNKYGTTPLHMAACYGNLKTVQILLDYGADKFAEADGGITAFDMTVHKYTDSYFKIAELLK